MSKCLEQFYGLRDYNACNHCQYQNNKECIKGNFCIWNDIEKELKEKDYIQKALDKIVDHCEIGFGGGKDEDGNWVIYLMFPNQQDITILCKDKEEYDFWVKYADM